MLGYPHLFQLVGHGHSNQEGTPRACDPIAFILVNSAFRLLHANTQIQSRIFKCSHNKLCLPKKPKTQNSPPNKQTNKQTNKKNQLTSSKEDENTFLKKLETTGPGWTLRTLTPLSASSILRVSKNPCACMYHNHNHTHIQNFGATISMRTCMYVCMYHRLCNIYLLSCMYMYVCVSTALRAMRLLF